MPSAFVWLTCHLEGWGKMVHTNSTQSSWSNQLHELVVAHITQKTLQTALPYCMWTQQVRSRNRKFGVQMFSCSMFQAPALRHSGCVSIHYLPEQTDRVHHRHRCREHRAWAGCWDTHSLYGSSPRPCQSLAPEMRDTGAHISKGLNVSICT